MDTGVQFAKAGILPHVVMSSNYTFPPIKHQEVFVLDAATRHMPPSAAYQTVYDIVRKALDSGFDCIYKKTDSGLRGNIGSELTAVLDASNETLLPFFPAYPKLLRWTINGTHYIDHVPVSQSIFGSDPFEPVTSSFVPEIIGQQSKVPVIQVGLQDPFPSPPQVPTVAVFDSNSSSCFQERVQELRSLRPPPSIMAGCAGFAEYLPELLQLKGSPIPASFPEKDLFVVSGSLNPITIQQLDIAESQGFSSILIPNSHAVEALSDPVFRKLTATMIYRQMEQHPRLILRIEKGTSAADQDPTFGATGKKIANNIGALLVQLVHMGMNRNIIITGGDMLHSFLEQVECSEIIPLGEIESGVVCSLLSAKSGKITVVSKSGGFGSKEVFSKIASFFQSHTIPHTASQFKSSLILPKKY